MSEEEIIRLQYEAFKIVSRGDRKFVLRMINDLGAQIREEINSRKPHKMSCNELCAVLEDATKDWDKNFYSMRN